MQFFQYGNVGLQSKIQAKDQEIVALQIHYVDYLTNEGKSIDKISLHRAIKKQNIPISLCANNIVIEGTRVECWWSVIRIAHFFRMEIRQMPLSHVPSGESIDWLQPIKIDFGISS